MIFITTIFLLVSLLVTYEYLRKERISLNKEILEIETFRLFRNKIRTFKVENLYDIEIIPKEYMWSELYGEENPKYVRYKMSFNYEGREVRFADGLDHKTAFTVLSKMNENPILAEKLSNNPSL